MTRPTKREIEKRLEDLREERGDGAERVHIVSDGDEYLSPGEYEDRHGHPVAESPGLVITVPEAAEGY